MLGVVVTVFVLGLITLVCLPVHAQEKAITLNFASFSPVGEQPTPFFDQWCKELDKRTNGRVKVTQFAGGFSPLPPRRMQASLKG